MKQRVDSLKRLIRLRRPQTNKLEEKDGTRVNRVRDGKLSIPTGTTEVQRTVSYYFENIYSSKWNNLEVNEFLVTSDLPKLSQEDLRNLNT